MDDLILSDFGNEKIIGPNIKNANILLFIGNIYVIMFKSFSRRFELDYWTKLLKIMFYVSMPFLICFGNHFFFVSFAQLSKGEHGRRTYFFYYRHIFSAFISQYLF